MRTHEKCYLEGCKDAAFVGRLGTRDTPTIVNLTDTLLSTRHLTSFWEIIG